MSFEVSAILLTWVVILLLALALSGLLRQVHVLSAALTPRRAITNPAIGATIPALGRIASSNNGSSLAAAFLFVDNHCASCSSLLARLGELTELPHEMRLVAMFPDEPNAEMPAPSFVEVIGKQQELFRDLSISMTPYAVAVAADGRVIDSEPVGSAELLEEFLLRARERVNVHDSNSV